MSPATLVSVLPLITGPLTLVAFVAWLVTRWLFERQKEKSLVEALKGEGIVKAGEAVKILEQFKSDESKLTALKEMLNYDNATANKILEKAKSITEVGGVMLQRLKIAQSAFQVVLVLCLFLLLTSIGLFAWGNTFTHTTLSLRQVEIGQADSKWNAKISYDAGQPPAGTNVFVEFSDDEKFESVWGKFKLEPAENDKVVAFEKRPANKVCARLVLRDSHERIAAASKTLCKELKEK